ncbi:DNA glycosylase [Aspergillus ellipticus CBS 707.79]|uniref:DNA glycosylase n=1 Tax=Aspergillus ellipticus CBS 707.79 TaxID=1448320 RepID=A0A319DA80_9EURO|nr:DNA glycosylase [Aspergillus ellipticus CBS 707.79]
MTRITRSAAAREAAQRAAETQLSQARTFETSQKPVKRVHFTLADTSADENRLSPSENRTKRRKTSATTSKQRTRTGSRLPPPPQLPHNLGPAINPSQTSDTKTPVKTKIIKREEADDLAAKLQHTVDKATQITDAGKKPKKKTNQYGLTPGTTPFPDWAHPTPEECEEVNNLLSTIHGEIIPPTTIPKPSLTVTGCGEVPSVLDALIRTLLSGATTGINSAMAFNGLVRKFGIFEGSVNWDAVRQASLQDIFEAIKCGGLADVKSKKIKAILDMVYEENQERRDVSAKPEGGKQYEVACVDQNLLSLNHLHSLRTEDAMMELVKYPGIGPKTAACVLLFCLQRPCFAVDTHIFRICKWLKWVPDKVTEVTAFSHLEVRIPDHLKYSLHQLFIHHGKSCPRCRAITGQSSAGWDKGCVIDHLVTRTGKRKGETVGEKDGGGRNGRKHRS